MKAMQILKKIENSKKKLATIIIPIYNKKEFTLEMLCYLFSNTNYPYEIIIIDNNSTDNSEIAIKEFFKQQKPENVSGIYIKNAENKGFSIANNQAAKIAKGEYLCFLNNDTLPQKNWLTELVKCHERNKAGITGAKLLIPGEGIIQHAGIEFDRFKYPYHIHYGKQANAKEVCIDKERSGVTGACILVTKKEFLEIGGFDENYWLGWEDVDLGNRYRELGKKIWYANKSVLYHYESMSDGRYSKETDNWYYYSKKWVFNQFK